MDISQIEPYIPIAISFVIGFMGAWYTKFKKIVKALSAALDDDRITAEELKAINDIIRGK